VIRSLTVSLADQNALRTKSIGIYNFALRFARALHDGDECRRLTLLANHFNRADLPARPRTGCRILDCSFPTRSALHRVLWDQAVLNFYCGDEWLFLPKGFAPIVIPVPARLAVYVHDVMGDHYRRCHPGYEGGLEAGYFNRSLVASLRRAEIVFTNTEFSRGEILCYARRRGIMPPRIEVIGYGFDPEPPCEMIKENRVIFFASKVPHKKTEMAVRYLEEWLRRSRFKGTVECVGILDDSIRRPEHPAFRWVGRLTPGDLKSLLRRSRVVLYTSEYEGFGMPPVEAVMAGACPVYSGIPPIREVMGDAGMAFDNGPVDSFCEALSAAFKVSQGRIETWRKTLLKRHDWSRVKARFFAGLDAA
jgi:glycosyltransferase involved in cell wall biosynthesis